MRGQVRRLARSEVIKVDSLCLSAGRTTGPSGRRLLARPGLPDGPVHADSGHRSDESCAVAPARYVRHIDLFDGQVNQPKW